MGDESVERFIRESIEKMMNRLLKNSETYGEYFVWNAASAYVKFWKLSNMKTELAETSPDGIVVSPHDYQTGCIITTFANRRKSTSILLFIMNFYESFVKKTEAKYPLIKKASVWNAIFSGIIEAVGIDEGLQMINKFRKEISNSDYETKTDIITRIDAFIHNLKNHGYLPKQLYFSIKRFHRWYQLNHSASLAAQAEMLYELYETYHLFDLEEEYPAVRTRFFLETVFYNSSQRFKDVYVSLYENNATEKFPKKNRSD
ncbi:MAG: hypothetical protein MZV64_69695 [Ignavibacteriales bacterium]|nr:hypothetical protein [Ignavibacteriales bacterium]